MSMRPPLEIIVTLPLEKRPLDELEQFRSQLDEALTKIGYGSCGLHELTSTGYFQFSCSLSNLHDGLNMLRERCEEMKPKPKVQVTLYGQDQNPIRIFPDNDLLEYLSGLGKGEKSI